MRIMIATVFFIQSLLFQFLNYIKSRRESLYNYTRILDLFRFGEADQVENDKILFLCRKNPVFLYTWMNDSPETKQQENHACASSEIRRALARLSLFCPRNRIYDGVK